MTAHELVELSQEIGRYYTPLVSDVMDTIGLSSGMLPRDIQGVANVSPQTRACGPAFPCRVVPTDQYVEIDTILQMVDSIPSDSIPVVASDSDIGAALWGGLMTRRAFQRDAVAAVVNGGVRDVAQIDEIDFPVFGSYRTVTDIRRRGYMKAFNVVVAIGGVMIEPGDLIFADANGVVRIRQSDAPRILSELRAAGTEEQAVATGLGDGKTARQMFDQNRRF